MVKNKSKVSTNVSIYRLNFWGFFSFLAPCRHLGTFCEEVWRPYRANLSVRRILYLCIFVFGYFCVFVFHAKWSGFDTRLAQNISWLLFKCIFLSLPYRNYIFLDLSMYLAGAAPVRVPRVPGHPLIFSNGCLAPVPKCPWISNFKVSICHQKYQDFEFKFHYLSTANWWR